MRVVALDLIRFFAAISVVLYHYVSRPESAAFPLFSEITKFGYLGVPLFFIISGYVIALSANNRTATQFAISRFVRLYPALWTGIIFTVLVTSLFTEDQYSALQLLANATLLNEYLGYNSIDGVYWTLVVELKFYACVYLLVTFGVFHQYRIWLSIWLGLTIIYAIFKQPFFMGWFISPGYSSFFIAGVAFFLIQSNGKNIFNYTILILSLLVSSTNGYVQAEGFLNNPSFAEKMTSVATIWGFYLLLFFLSTGKIDLKNRNLFVTLGALTYPLYLVHSNAGKALIDYYSLFVSEEFVIVLVIFLMLIVAWVIHLLIEKPLSTPLKNYLLRIFTPSKS